MARWLGVALMLLGCVVGCSDSGNDDTSGSGGGSGGGGQQAPAGTEGGFCNPPSGTCAACRVPECNDGLACYPEGPGALGNYGTCLPRGNVGDSCHIWVDSVVRGTCDYGPDVNNMSCCQVEGSTGTCFLADDPACAGASACDRCLDNCRGMSNCCTGTGCICDSVC